MNELLQRVEDMRSRLATEAVPAAEIRDLLGDVAAAMEANDPVAAVMKTISFTEAQAIDAVLQALPEERGGLIVSSKIADEHNLTRSIVVSAIRKLEAGGLLEARSLGQKGTMIKLLGGLTVDKLRERLAEHKH